MRARCLCINLPKKRVSYIRTAKLIMYTDEMCKQKEPLTHSTTTKRFLRWRHGKDEYMETGWRYKWAHLFRKGSISNGDLEYLVKFLQPGKSPVWKHHRRWTLVCVGCVLWPANVKTFCWCWSHSVCVCRFFFVFLLKCTSLGILPRASTLTFAIASRINEKVRANIVACA